LKGKGIDLSQQQKGKTMLPKFIVICTFAIPIGYAIARFAFQRLPLDLRLKIMDIAYPAMAGIVALPLFDKASAFRAAVVSCSMIYTGLRATGRL
jgi:hypothetical protein